MAARTQAEARAEPLHSYRFPNASAAYRAARDKLLRDEMALRKHVGDIAALRRALPPPA